MKTFITLIFILSTYPTFSQDLKQSATDEVLHSIAKNFLTDFYTAKYDSCLSYHHISYIDNRFLLMSDIESIVISCENDGGCYKNSNFEYKSLYTTYNSRYTQDKTPYEIFQIYFQFNNRSYSEISLINRGKGWFIGYVDPQPQISQKWNTITKLNKIKIRRDQ